MRCRAPYVSLDLSNEAPLPHGCLGHVAEVRSAVIYEKPHGL
ncbi:hypothetical protein [Streptomyces sp. NBC_00829]|nr:hypothetical protein OG293_16725 [Streptomyces sp. NBC_00829]